MSVLNINEVAVKKALKPVQNADGTWVNGGFVASKITNVRVETNTYASGEFANCDAPTLVIEFENYSANAPHATYQHRIGIPPSMKYSVPGDKNSSMVAIDEKNTAKSNQDMWRLVKHFNDAFLGKANARDFATLTEKEANDNLDLVVVGEPGVRIASYTKFFNFIAAWMNGTYLSKKGDAVRPPVYTDKDGSSIGVWMVLLPVAAGKGVKYQLPGFMRSGGLIEVMNINVKGEIKFPVSLELTDKSVLTLKADAKVADTGIAAGAAPQDISSEIQGLL